MPNENPINRRTALQSICVGAGAALGPGVVTGSGWQTGEARDLSEFKEEVLREWQSLVDRHGTLSDFEYAARDRQNRVSSGRNAAAGLQERQRDGGLAMVQRLEFEDGHTTDVRTEIERNRGSRRQHLGTFRKEIDGTRFETAIPGSLRDDLRRERQDRRARRARNYRRTTVDTEFAERFDRSEHEITSLSDRSFRLESSHYDYEADQATDGNRNHDCPIACWVQGINFATDVDQDDNRCGVSAIDAVVSIEADAYAEVFTVVNNDVKTGKFDVTFDGYTRGTVSSLGMAAGTEFSGFVRNVDDGTTDSTLLGTLDSNWYDAVDTIDARWGPGHGAGPGGDAPFTDYQLTTELEEGESYAFGIRMEVDLANISLPGSITINFTDTTNPLDDDFGMSYDVIGVDW